MPRAYAVLSASLTALGKTSSPTAKIIISSSIERRNCSIWLLRIRDCRRSNCAPHVGPTQGECLDFIPLLIRPDPSVLSQQPFPCGQNVNHASGTLMFDSSSSVIMVAAFFSKRAMASCSAETSRWRVASFFMLRDTCISRGQFQTLHRLR